MPLTRGRSVRFDGYLHRDSIGAAPSGAAPNILAALPRCGRARHLLSFPRNSQRVAAPIASEVPEIDKAARSAALSEHASSHPESSAYVADLTRDRRADAAAPLPGDLGALREPDRNDQRADEPRRDEEQRRVRRER